MPTKEEYAERRLAWIAALRGDQYAQGRGALRGEDSYCCLGVACDVSKVAAWELYGKSDLFAANYCYGNELGIPPQSVQDYYGVCPSFMFLISLNDDQRLTFNQIADCILANPDKMWLPGTY